MSQVSQSFMDSLDPTWGLEAVQKARYIIWQVGIKFDKIPKRKF